MINLGRSIPAREREEEEGGREEGGAWGWSYQEMQGPIQRAIRAEKEKRR